jgi:hypothetical protein
MRPCEKRGHCRKPSIALASHPLKKLVSTTRLETGARRGEFTTVMPQALKSVLIVSQFVQMLSQYPQLCWKLYCIAPFYYILHPFSLINLMNQFGRMIDQAHRCFAWHFRPTEPIDIGNAQAMKAKMWLLDFDEELLPTTRGLEWKFQGKLLFLLQQLFE